MNEVHVRHGLYAVFLGTIFGYLEKFLKVVKNLKREFISFPECYEKFGLRMKHSNPGLWLPHAPDIDLLQGDSGLAIYRNKPLSRFISDQTREFFDAFTTAAEQSLLALYNARDGPPPKVECLLGILKPKGLKPATSEDMTNVVVWYDPQCKILMPTLERRKGCPTKKRWILKVALVYSLAQLFTIIPIKS